MSSKRSALSFLVFLAPSFFSSSPASSQQAGSLSIQALVDIKHPSTPEWSPDGRRIAFVWNRAGVENVFLLDVSGAGDAPAPPPPRALTHFDSGDAGSLFWSADGRAVRFARGGDLWSVDVDAADGAAPLWTTSEPETGFAPSPDRTAVAFSRDGDLWIHRFAGGDEKRLTETPILEGGFSWSPDGTHIAFVTFSAKQHEEAPEYSGAKILYTWIERGYGDVGVVPVGGGPALTLMPSAEFRESGIRWLDRSRLLFERVHDDTTRREIVVADAATGVGKVVVSERDEKWWSIPGPARPGAQPSPDGKWISFVSDRDGWDHLYVVASSGGAPIQITRGAFEAWRPEWSPDGKHIAFDANEPERPGVRHIGVADLGTDPGNAAVRSLTSGRGTNISAEWSPDGKRIVFQHTDPRSPADLFLVASDAKEKTPEATRLTDSLPAGIDRSLLVEPELVWYPAADGEKVPAYLFVPKNLDRSKKHPAIVWIHGDGHNQNYDGWHVERNYSVYYSFHQYLLQKGYVVIAPDYRGSIGYGKKWRQGVFLDVGGKDSADATQAATYLKSLDYVDPGRIGVWGLSYGGFFTLLALVDSPTTFACGVDVAGVVDYRMYWEDPWHGSWTYGRLRAPEDNPHAYDVASPLSRMDRLVRPLLILHGTSDVNVPYLHSVRLIDDLLRRGKSFDFMIYPGEFHYFTRAHVLSDAWGRVERFFDQHLNRPGRP
jgi:dipeptidyl aminopeptidase/acylaminoacyl peptidase